MSRKQRQQKVIIHLDLELHNYGRIPHVFQNLWGAEFHLLSETLDDVVCHVTLHSGQKVMSK